MTRRSVPLLATLALAALATTGSSPLRAENLIVNAGFDTSIAGWTPGNGNQGWSPLDAAGSGSSGSARGLIDQAPGPFTAVTFRQCVPLIPGTEYTFGATALVPGGQGRTGAAAVALYVYANPGCAGPAIEVENLDPVASTGTWVTKSESLVASSEARSANLFLNVTKNETGGELVAHFDDAFVCAEGDCTVSAPAPPYGTWITSPARPGFEAQVRITPAGAGPIQGARETDCIAETICVRGALAGRPEIFVKVIGPRPNGYLWAQLTRFTPSKVEVWLRQTSSSKVNYYRLDAVAPGSGILSGLEDRDAYLP